jgi:hypothetical protein
MSAAKAGADTNAASEAITIESFFICDPRSMKRH